MPDDMKDPAKLGGNLDVFTRSAAQNSLSKRSSAFDRWIGRSFEELFQQDTFISDMQDLLTRKRSGHSAKHIFKGKSFALWETFNEAAAYYPFHDDAQLIEDSQDCYKALGEFDILADLGVGSRIAVSKKPLKVAGYVNAKSYLGVDYSPESLAAAETIIKTQMPHLRIATTVADFDRHIFDVPTKGRRIMVQYGGTLGNMEGFIEGPLPHDAVTGALRNYRRHLNKGDIFVLSLDKNRNKDEIDACYADPINEQFAMATLERLEQELIKATYNMSGFRADNYKFGRFWNEEIGLYALGYEALNDTTFSISGNKVSVRQGQKFSNTNSYKYDDAFLNEVIPAGGFKIKECLAGKGKRMHHYFLEPV